MLFGYENAHVFAFIKIHTTAQSGPVLLMVPVFSPPIIARDHFIVTKTSNGRYKGNMLSLYCSSATLQDPVPSSTLPDYRLADLSWHPLYNIDIISSALFYVPTTYLSHFPTSLLAGYDITRHTLSRPLSVLAIINPPRDFISLYDATCLLGHQVLRPVGAVGSP